jgi:hypothetical protein
MRLLLSTLVLTVALPAMAQAQAPVTGATILGTWNADLKDQKRKDAPRTVIVRADSSASYGTETVRWRLKADSIMLALGGEWVTYKLDIKASKLTLSGGDLVKPVSLTKAGPPSERPAGTAIPPDPDVP